MPVAPPPPRACAHPRLAPSRAISRSSLRPSTVRRARRTFHHVLITRSDPTTTTEVVDRGTDHRPPRLRPSRTCRTEIGPISMPACHACHARASVEGSSSVEARLRSASIGFDGRRPKAAGRNQPGLTLPRRCRGRRGRRTPARTCIGSPPPRNSKLRFRRDRGASVSGLLVGSRPWLTSSRFRAPRPP